MNAADRLQALTGNPQILLFGHLPLYTYEVQETVCNYGKMTTFLQLASGYMTGAKVTPKESISKRETLFPHHLVLFL